MKILFDTNTPAPLARALRGHQVTRTGELGWASLENGKLLDAAERGGFEVLITCDQNMRYQQNFADRKIAVLVLSTNHWPDIQPVAARISTIVDFLQRGQVNRVDVMAL